MLQKPLSSFPKNYPFSIMSMETNPPTSELMSPVHSFPNRFIDNDEERSEERKSDRSIPDEERGFVMKMLIYEV
uniref:Uncharacterized protein n=1 Tax=Helianthus annuus TaxID=4232 RepID=A0A251SI91_HELAN